jgi:uncharacterized protein YprB with RNaseH-like and TPR domain
MENLLQGIGCISDCETTGLSGGTGTIPFLIGLGFWKDQQFHLYQLFLHQRMLVGSAYISFRGVNAISGCDYFQWQIF